MLTYYPPYAYREDYGYDSTVAHKCECSGTAVNTEFRRIRAMMPFEFIDAKAVNFDWTLYGEDVTVQKKIINAFIKKFEQFEQEGKGLYLYSKTKGSGKTMLACCIANEILERKPISTKFITVLDFIELVKKTYSYKEHGEELKSLFQARLLILDDMGVEMRKGENEHTNQVLYRLINERVSKKLVTVITSNEKIQNLRTDERIIDRIYKMAIQVEIPEVAIRTKLAESENFEFLEELLTGKKD